LGELHQTFVLDVSPKGIKCLHLILGVLLPENFGAENVVFNYAILRLYCKYLQIEQDIVDWKMALQTAITPLHVYQIW